MNTDSWRVISPRRARKLRKRGEMVVWDGSRHTWRPGWAKGLAYYEKQKSFVDEKIETKWQWSTER